METLSVLYLDTINPLTPYSRLCSLDVLCSIVLHMILYITFIYVIVHVFSIKLVPKQYTNIVYCLLVVMCLGYIGRLARSKSLYIALLTKGASQKQALKNTIDIMNNGYFTYYFLG